MNIQVNILQENSTQKKNFIIQKGKITLINIFQDVNYYIIVIY